MRFAVIIEGLPGSYSAYVPDLPGCVAVGDTVDQTLKEMEEAIRFHLDGLQEDGLPIPQPTTLVDYVEL